MCMSLISKIPPEGLRFSATHPRCVHKHINVLYILVKLLCKIFT